MKPAYEVAGVIRQHIDQLEDLVPNAWNRRTLYAIAHCRTPQMGGHIDRCSNPKCGKVHLSYNSCRNRHCPKCQGHKREEWIAARENELLKVPYYHVVFTLPSELNGLFLGYKKEMYSLLFKLAWEVIVDFAANPKFIGGKTGMIAILHTWGQNLSFHPHLHCIVLGGGITAGGKWKDARSKEKFLFPVKEVSRVFRARFVKELRKILHLKVSPNIYKKLFDKAWVVYCKRPFFGPQQVVEYLGRYTHKVAISNHRLREVKDGKVVFSAKDYKKGEKKYLETLSTQEFIRRFALHILPKGFVRIRHYGLLSSLLKGKMLPRLREQLGEVVITEKPKLMHRICPACKVGKLETILIFDGRGPPKIWQHKVSKSLATA